MEILPGFVSVEKTVWHSA